VPGWGKADNNSGSRSRLNDRPPPADFMMARAHRAHPKAEYTTATDPLPKVRDQSVRCLQGESIHELLGRATWLHARRATSQSTAELGLRILLQGVQISATELDVVAGCEVADLGAGH